MSKKKSSPPPTPPPPRDVRGIVNENEKRIPKKPTPRPVRVPPKKK